MKTYEMLKSIEKELINTKYECEYNGNKFHCIKTSSNEANWQLNFYKNHLLLFEAKEILNNEMLNHNMEWRRCYKNFQDAYIGCLYGNAKYYYSNNPQQEMYLDIDNKVQIRTVNNSSAILDVKWYQY